ncbi:MULTISPECIES: BadF/BadG/BcrA/BcrD ATPase family protein [unclassified Rhizobium]|uniref:BadF/BadG/BcrA/BcrD ATPase family protein n=1 Tax=unclassified Rhizobium TaxID=2613769 RepID=UPI000EA92682|nr:MULTISPECIES: BadF/BadG/BcrA/BcrD ATPase family protein [unclassified Rhizobium]AYG68229.1 N-acetylglucosamine kinase [Rhizobium sp. CCGE531]AYG74612.1 N-acetylglucosamine kinase [Rhizobium sp. CCGE532]
MGQFAIGIDGGGTSCRAAVIDRTGQVLGTGKAGAANILSDLENSLIHIVASARQALIDAKLDPELLQKLPAVIGTAGANVGNYGKRVEGALPFASTRVVTDATIALQGALGDADGIIGAFGTGSVYNARRDGKSWGIGGWGFVIGDQASGARLGRDLLERALLAHDGVMTGSALTTSIMAEYGNDPERIVEFAHVSKPKDFARYAPIVFECAGAEDVVAIDIVRTAARSITDSLNALLWPGCPSICLLGGLAQAYRPWLDDRHKAMLAEPKGDVLRGAVELAAKLLRGGEGNRA